MKLHLPTSLRKAVLTCLAALASALPSTLASGALVAGGFCSFAAAAAVASADDEDGDDDEYGIMPIADESGWDWKNPGNVGWKYATDLPGATAGNATAPGLTDLKDETASGYKVAGAQGHYRFTGGAAGSSLLLDHNGGAGNPVYLYFDKCNVADLWLTNLATGNIGNTRNYYMFTETTGLGDLKNIYVSRTNLCFGKWDGSSVDNAAALYFSANIILGPLDGAASTLGGGAGGGMLNIAHRSVTTTGYLEMSAANTIVFGFADSALSVSELRGSEDLTVKTVAAGATLTLVNGSDKFDGMITFSDNALSVVLGSKEAEKDVVVLQTKGLSGSAGANIQKDGGYNGSGVVRITTANEKNAVWNVTISGLSLELDKNATQTFSSLTFKESKGTAITLNEGSTLGLDTASSVDLKEGKLVILGNATLAISVVEKSSAALLTLSHDSLQDILDSKLQIALIGSFGKAEEISFKLLDLGDIKLSADECKGITDMVKDMGEFGERAKLTLSEDGTLTISTGVALVWEDGNGDWLDNAKGGNWNDDELFTNKSSVTFGSGKGTVTVKGDVIAGNVTLNGGEWNFVSDGDEKTSLHITGDLTLKEKGKTTVSVGTKLDGGITVGEDAELVMSNLTMANNATAKIDKGGSLHLSLAADASGLKFTGDGKLYIDVTEKQTRSLAGKVSFEGVDADITLGNESVFWFGSSGGNNGIDGNGNITVHVDKGSAAKFTIAGGHSGCDFTGVITLDGDVEFVMYGATLKMRGLVSGTEAHTSSVDGPHTIEMGSKSETGDIYEFKGLFNAVGSGNITVSKKDAGTQIFSGGVSDYIHFKVNEKGGTLEVSCDIEGASHNLEVQSGGTFIYSGKGEAYFSSHKGDGTLVVKNGTLVLASAADTKGTLSLADGGSLHLMSAGATSFASLKVDKNTSGGLGLDVIAGAQLNVADWAVEGTLSVSLLGIEQDNADSLNADDYFIFANWNDIKDLLAKLRDEKLLTINEAYIGRRVISFNWDDGTLDITDDEAKELTWKGGKDWFDASADRNRSDEYWTAQDNKEERFYNYDSVIFEKEGGQVTLNGDIEADNVTVKGDWKFVGEGGDDSFAINGTLTVAEGKSLEIAGVTYSGSSLVVEGGGSATLSNSDIGASSFTVGGDVTLQGVTLKTGGTLSAMEGAKLALTAENGSEFRGKLVLGDNAVLSLGSDLTITGWGAGMGTDVTIDSVDGKEHTFTLDGAGHVGRNDASFTFGENVTVKKTGTGLFSFVGDNKETAGSGMLTIAGKLVVEGGQLYINNGANLQDVEVQKGAQLYFWKNSEQGRVVHGKLSGDGEIQTITEKLRLLGGGTLGGNLVVGWAANVWLGQDLEVGGIGSSGGAASSINKDADAKQDVVLTVNNKENTSATAADVQFKTGVTLRKTGSGTQSFTGNSQFADVEVEAGVLNISGVTTKTISGNVTISGGSLNWGDAHLTVGGNFSATTDVTVTGDLTVTGAVDIQSSFTVSKERTVVIGSQGGSISKLTMGGTLTLSGGTLEIGELDTDGSGAVINISLEGSTKLTVGKLGGNIAKDTLSIQLTLEEALAHLNDGYQLFEGTLPAETDWEKMFNVGISDSEAALVKAVLENNGHIKFELLVNELRWTGTNGVWQEKGEAKWEELADASKHEAFANRDFVTFDNAQGGTMTVSGELIASKLSVAQGNWTFADAADGKNSLTISNGVDVQSGSATFTLSSLTLGGTLSGEIHVEAENTTLSGALNVSKDAQVSFGGDGSVVVDGGDSVTLESGATLTIGNTGKKSFGAISVAEGASVIISTTSGWKTSEETSEETSKVTSKVTGDGTLVLKDIRVGAEDKEGYTKWEDYLDMMGKVIDTTGTDTANTTVSHIGSIVLDNVQILLDTNAKSNDQANYFRSAKEVHLTSGSSIGLDGATFNNGAGKMLYLAGSGADGEGVLYLTGSTDRIINWNVVLEEDATINSNQESADSMVGFLLRRNYDGNKKVLSKVGNGLLSLEDLFNTAAGSEGGFRVSEGVLRLALSGDARATALANYDVLMDGGQLVLSADAAIRRLGGNSADSTVKSANATVYTLTVNNTDNEATGDNTYAGGVAGQISLNLTGGYQKLTGTLGDGAGLSVAGGSGAAVLEVAGTLEGAHTIQVGADATLKLADAKRGDGAKLTILASGTTGVIDGLTLGSGDVLGFVNAPVDGNDPEVVATLTGATVLHGGSTLQFGVAGSGDAPDKWKTATKLQVNGTLSVNAEGGEAINLVVDPYGRMADGEIIAMEVGKHLLIEGGVTDEVLAAFKPNQLQGRFVYELEQEGENLYISVIEGAVILVWNETAGGEWKKDMAWYVESNHSSVTFRDGDAVIFDTLAGATDPVKVTIDGDAVSVGGITVKGSTSYEIAGNITGVDDSDVVDLGLTVGTESNAFSGTLTLSGENSWQGDTVINSGTVVAGSARALSDTAVMVKEGAELQLNLNGGELAAQVELGGVLTALTDATVTLAETTAASETLQAASGATLVVNTPATLGELAVNADAQMTGEVQLNLENRTTVAAGLDVQRGVLALAAVDAEAGLSAETIQVNAEAQVTVGSGVTLSGGSVDVKGELVMEADSVLSADGAIYKLTSRGAELNGNDYMLVSGELTLEGGASAMTGEWDVARVSGSELATASGADVTLRAGSLEAADVQGSVLHVGDGLHIGSLALNAGTLAGADDNPAVVSVDTVSVSGDAEVRREVTVQISGSGSEISGGSVAGTLAVDSADGSAELTVSGGEVSGEISIGQGRVTLSPDAAVTGHVSMSGAGSVLDLGGSATGAGISMTGGGVLQNAESYTGTLVLDDGGKASGIAFDLGGLGADAKMTIVSLTGGNTVSNLDSLTLVGENTIYLNEALQVGKGTVQPLFSFTGSATLTLEAGAGLFVDVSSIIGDVLAAGDDGIGYRVANKSIGSWDGLFTYDATALVLGWEIEYYGNGIMLFRASGELPERNIYQSTEQQGGSSSWADAADDRDIYESVGSWGAIVVDKQTDIDLAGTSPTGKYAQTGLLIHNLMGTDKGVLTITGDGSQKVTLRNDVSEDELDDLREQLGSDLVRNGLTYGGSLEVSGADMEVAHVDGMFGTRPSVNSTTTIKGNLTLTNGDLIMTAGRLELEGDANELTQDVSFHDYQGQISVSGKLTVGGTIAVEHFDNSVGEQRAHLALVHGGELVLAEGAAVEAGVVIGSDAVSDEPTLAGTIVVGEDWMSDAGTVSAAAKLRHVVLEVNGTLLVDTEDAPAMMRAVAPAEDAWVLAGLTGSGTLATTSEATLAAPAVGKDMAIAVAGEDRCFSGDLSGYTGTMTFKASGYTQYFTGVQGGSGWSVTNTRGGHLVFNMAENGANNTLTMGTLHAEGGSYTTILLDLKKLGPAAGLHLQGLALEDGADVTIGQYRGTVWLEGNDGDVHEYVLGVVNVAEGGENYVSDGVQWHLKGVRNAKDVRVSVDNDGKVTAAVTQDNSNLYARYADNVNSAVGAGMLWAPHDTKDLAALDNALYELLGPDAPVASADIAKANKMMAAAAGASLAAISGAVSADVERQLRTVRNRTTVMNPAAQSDVTANTWVNAENTYYKQDADGLMPGFKTTGWGGTVGVDTAVGESTVLGFALSAMYNDVDTEGPDRLKADMDTYYVSAFAQMSSGAWRHTFVCTLGRADIETERTVNYGTGSYTTKGSTDSMALGLMYELGYSTMLNEAGTSCLQGVVNLQWRMSRINDYTETGSDAALAVKGQNYNALTLGVGARLQAAVGADAWNRIGVLEARALVKAELADRYGEAGVALSQGGAPGGVVRGSEKGTVGVELGAGLTVPVSSVSNIFVDVSAELWQNLVEMNASVGYRVSF